MNRKRKAFKSRIRSRRESNRAKRRKRSKSQQTLEQPKDDGTIPDVQKCFLTYQQITNYLATLADKYPSKLMLSEIGLSVKGHAILMAKVLMGGHGVTSSNSKSSPYQEGETYCGCAANRTITFIEAGSNGCDWISIAAALYMIDHLVKSEPQQTNIDYFIVPCSNPDSYTDSFTPGNTLVNLSVNYPIILGTSDMSRIKNQLFIKTIMEWKQSYRHRRPESTALIHTIDTFQGNIKLFVSLQEGASKPKILYPYGSNSDMLPDADMVTHIAKSALSMTHKLSFNVGSIYNVCGLTFGSIIDYLAITRGLNFSYVMHINNRLIQPNASKIQKVGKDVVVTITSMAKEAKSWCDSQAF